ncbi:unnamed protein product, partial [Phaeothamnion confervicola]
LNSVYKESSWLESVGHLCTTSGHSPAASSATMTDSPPRFFPPHKEGSSSDDSSVVVEARALTFVSPRFDRLPRRGTSASSLETWAREGNEGNKAPSHSAAKQQLLYELDCSGEQRDVSSLPSGAMGMTQPANRLRRLRRHSSVSSSSSSLEETLSLSKDGRNARQRRTPGARRRVVCNSDSEDACALPLPPRRISAVSGSGGGGGGGKRRGKTAQANAAAEIIEISSDSSGSGKLATAEAKRCSVSPPPPQALPQSRVRPSPAAAAPSPRPAKTPGGNFARGRVLLTERLFCEFDAAVFGSRLVGKVPVTWNVRLLRTAGVTRLTRRRRELLAERNGEGERQASIDLSVKVVDSEHKLRQTLLHELCHAAAWLVDGVDKPPHGPAFWRWARRAAAAYPSVPVTTRHTYEIKYKFQYDGGGGCGAVIGRHSRSIDVQKQVCGRCGGALVMRPLATAPRKPSAFSLFVKERFASVRAERPGVGHGAVMTELGRIWAAEGHRSSTA